MKQKILAYTAIGLLTTATFMGCSTASQPKVDEAKNSAKSAVNSLDEARKTDANVVKQTADQDLQAFKKEMEDLSRQNQARINELKSKIAASDAKNRARLNQDLDKLEQKNNELKKRLEEYREEDKQKAAASRTEFKHDMDELGKALKDFTVDNVK
jgi:uncharacterized protein (DUF305 family)